MNTNTFSSPGSSEAPAPEAPAKRRRFSARYKLRILEEADACAFIIFPSASATAARIAGACPRTPEACPRACVAHCRAIEESSRAIEARRCASEVRFRVRERRSCEDERCPHRYYELSVSVIPIALHAMFARIAASTVPENASSLAALASYASASASYAAATCFCSAACACAGQGTRTHRIAQGRRKAKDSGSGGLSGKRRRTRAEGCKPGGYQRGTARIWIGII